MTHGSHSPPKKRSDSLPSKQVPYADHTSGALYRCNGKCVVGEQHTKIYIWIWTRAANVALAIVAGILVARHLKTTDDLLTASPARGPNRWLPLRFSGLRESCAGLTGRFRDNIPHTPPACIAKHRKLRSVTWLATSENSPRWT